MFLYSIEGSIPADAATDDRKQALVRRICVELKRFDWEATCDGNVVSFLNNKNIFHQMVRLDRTTQLVDSGEFIIDGESIRYRLETSPLVFWTAVLPLPLAFCLVMRSLIGVASVIGYWLLTCVGGTFWISFRVRRALQRAAVILSPSLSP